MDLTVLCLDFWIKVVSLGAFLRIESLCFPSGCVRDAFGMRSVFDRSSIVSRSVFDRSSIILRLSFVHPSFVLRFLIEEQSKNDRRSSIVSSEDHRSIIVAPSECYWRVNLYL